MPNIKLRKHVNALISEGKRYRTLLNAIFPFFMNVRKYSGMASHDPVLFQQAVIHEMDIAIKTLQDEKMFWTQCPFCGITDVDGWIAEHLLSVIQRRDPLSANVHECHKLREFLDKGDYEWFSG